MEPLAYHAELRDYLKTQERDLWNWFASARAQADYTDNLRMNLLKSTYLRMTATPGMGQSSLLTQPRFLNLNTPLFLPWSLFTSTAPFARPRRHSGPRFHFATGNQYGRALVVRTSPTRTSPGACAVPDARSLRLLRVGANAPRSSGIARAGTRALVRQRADRVPDADTLPTVIHRWRGDPKKLPADTGE